MKNIKVYAVIRVLFGLWLIATGVNFFVPFIPEAKLAPAVGEFLGALFTAGYVFPIVGVVFVIAGLSFVFDRYVALGATLLAPISVNILLLHAYLDKATIVPALVLVLLNIYMAWVHADLYKPLFRARG